jgi:hypothetical protein
MDAPSTTHPFLVQAANLKDRFFTRERLKIVEDASAAINATFKEYAETDMSQPMYIHTKIPGLASLYNELLTEVPCCLFNRFSDMTMYFMFCSISILHIFLRHRKDPPTNIYSLSTLLDVAKTNFCSDTVKDIMYASAVYMVGWTCDGTIPAKYKSSDPSQQVTDEVLRELYGYFRRCLLYLSWEIRMVRGDVVDMPVGEVQSPFTLSLIKALVNDAGLGTKFGMLYEPLLMATLEETQRFNFYAEYDGTRGTVCLRELWEKATPALGVVLEDINDASADVDRIHRQNIATLCYLIVLAYDQSSRRCVFSVRLNNAIFLAEDGDMCFIDSKLRAVYHKDKYHVFRDIVSMFQFACDIQRSLHIEDDAVLTLLDELRALVAGQYDGFRILNRVASLMQDIHGRPSTSL